MSAERVEWEAAEPDLRSHLLAFLALHAPFLSETVHRTRSDERLEERLLARLERLYRPRNSEAARELFPGARVGEEAEAAARPLADLIRGFFVRWRLRQAITPEERRLMLRTMLLTRAVDDGLKAAFDAKTVAWGEHPSPQKGFRSRGQEAIVGAALRLRRPPEWSPGAEYRGDVIAPMIRDLGALFMFMPDALHPFLVQYGKLGTPVQGRDLHVGDLTQGVLPPTAPLGIATQTLIGMAWAFKIQQEERVGVSFIGEGGSSLGEWHEAINFAAVQRLPMLFIVENNVWALGTHVTEQSAVRRFADKAVGYGIPGLTLFGNDPDEIAVAAEWAAERARQGEGPTLLELVSYRRPGHAHHDDDRYHGNPEAGIPGYEFPEEGAAWRALDPIQLYVAKLRRLEILDDSELEALQHDIETEVEQAQEAADAAPWPRPEHYRARLFAPRRMPRPKPNPEAETRSMAYDEAIRDALRCAMQESPGVAVLGEDVGGRYGGAFGVTRGLAKEFGEERCLNTPLAESAIVGCGVGAALVGMRPVVEMQFADFLAPAFNALVNNAAKLHWRWGAPVPLVVRLPYGGATGSQETLLGGGPFHSQCPEMWFVRTPGWKVVAPSDPRDAKGLLLAAIRDENPVLYLEAKGLYGFFRTDLRQKVPTEATFEVPIGEAVVRREGEDCSILTYGSAVWTALAAATRLETAGISAEVVDLRSLVPLDEAAVSASVRKTGRVLLLHEDIRRGGFGGELGAEIAERLFWFLETPIRRLGAADTPAPYSPPLESDYLLAVEEVVTAVEELVGS